MIPYGRQTIEDDDIAAVSEALRAPLLTTGPLVEEYEEAFAEAVGAPYAVACNSGTSALHLACDAAGLAPGRAAIVPSITFVATANAVRMTGAEVILADVDPQTGMMTEETMVAASREASEMGLPDAQFVLPVDLNGARCAALDAVAKRVNDIIPIRDACHSLGSGQSFAEGLTCFSTHPLKSVTTGEGGMVTTDIDHLARYMRYMRSHGMTRDHLSFMLGFNYRLPDVMCALGLNQLRKMERFVKRRAEIASLYTSYFTSLAPKGIRPVLHTGKTHSWHLYVILVERGRNNLREHLRSCGINTQIHYRGLHTQPFYVGSIGDRKFPGADTYSKQCLSLPIYPSLTDSQVEQIVSIIVRWADGSKEVAA